MLEDRSRRDWEARKKRIFEELGGRTGGPGGSEGRSIADLRKSMRASTSLSVCADTVTNLTHSNLHLL